MRTRIASPARSRLMQRLKLALVLGMSVLLLSGCWMRTLMGNVVYEEVDEEGNTVKSGFIAESSVADCIISEGQFYCHYMVGGIDGFDVTSTIDLLSEFGIFGIMIDPIILQVPDSITGVTGAYDDGKGPKSLVIQHGLKTIPVDSATTMTPEPGHHFAILELPDGIPLGPPTHDPKTGRSFSFSLEMTGTVPKTTPRPPFEVKAIFAGRVDTGGRTYYVPLLPCTSDFATVPAVEIPEAAQPVNLLSTVENLLRINPSVGCAGKQYTFADPPIQQEVWMPVMLR